MSLSLAKLNRMDQAAFTEALGFLFEHSPWVVERAYADAPFASLDDLFLATTSVLGSASQKDRLALIRSHPELADKAGLKDGLTAASEAEQSGAGLDRLALEESRKFREGNLAYREKFGFPFVICARLNDKSSMLEAMSLRLQNSPTEEIEAAIGQISLIGRIRLFDAVSP